eukprot:151862-Pyramimonas_sp.AAC.1
MVLGARESPSGCGKRAPWRCAVRISFGSRFGARFRRRILRDPFPTQELGGPRPNRLGNFMADSCGRSPIVRSSCLLAGG